MKLQVPSETSVSDEPNKRLVVGLRPMEELARTDAEHLLAVYLKFAFS